MQRPLFEFSIQVGILSFFKFSTLGLVSQVVSQIVWVPKPNSFLPIKIQNIPESTRKMVETFWVDPKHFPKVGTHVHFYHGFVSSHLASYRFHFQSVFSQLSKNVRQYEFIPCGKTEQIYLRLVCSYNIPL